MTLRAYSTPIDRYGRARAELEGGLVVTSSTKPLLDAARALLARGKPAMRRITSLRLHCLAACYEAR